MGVGQVQDNYFVRLDVAGEPASPRGVNRGSFSDPHSRPLPVGSRRAVARESFSPAPSAPRSRRRRRVSVRSVFLSLLAIGLGVWVAWASQQPGGISGVTNGFLDHVRGRVESVSSGPDVRHAATYFNEQFAQTGSYPRLTEEQSTAAGIGIDIDVERCGEPSSRAADADDQPVADLPVATSVKRRDNRSARPTCGTPHRGS